MDKSHAERALWMVLITSLVAPFIAALAEVAVQLAGPAIGFGIESSAESSASTAIGVFAWSAIPATLGALALAPFVLTRGTYGWLEAAVIGVIAFSIADFVWPFTSPGHALPYFAVLAGLVALAIRALLIKARILKAD